MGLVLASMQAGWAQTVAEPGLLCRAAIRLAEAGSGLPPTLLSGIARVESGRRDPVSGRMSPWPWTINAEGKGSFFETKAEAVAYARQLRARGVQSFDAGCLQVNLMYHPGAFASLEEAFDPVANARYAVKFLTTLREKSGSWEEASAWYHSANPEHGVPYRARVVSAMAEEARSAASFASLPDPARMASGWSGGALGGGAMSSMPSRQGSMILLSHTGGGGVGGGVVGRGLDAYRAQPVALVGQRLMAAR